MPTRLRALIHRLRRILPLVLVAAALVLVVVGIALQGFAVGVAAIVPLALASYMGHRDEREGRIPLRR
jgi:hypothetical protein